MLTEVMAELAALGTEQTKKTLMNHGAVEPLFGVRIGDLKKELVKKYRGNKDLAIELIKTENSDAQYLAGLIMPVKKISGDEITALLPYFKWFAMNEAVLAPLAADSGNGRELSEKWLASTDDITYHTGVVTLSKTISVVTDDDLPKDLIDRVLADIGTGFDQASESLQYSYNQFLITLGSYTLTYHDQACERLSTLVIDRSAPGCRIPDGLAQVKKVEVRGKLGIKRKKAMC